MFRAWALRSCNDCRTFMYRHTDDGSLVRRPQSDPNGVPQRRAAKTSLPCHLGPAGNSDRCPKIPDDATSLCPASAEDLSPHNEKAWRHYREAKAVGFTEEEKGDWLVRRNAAVIKSVYDELESQNMVAMALMLRRRTKDE